MPALIKSTRSMQHQADTWRQRGERIALVPTMGYLHRGHLSLVERAQSLGQRCVVSVFVNPLQFGPKEDFAIYPRDLARDLELLNDIEVDAVFHPSADDFYAPSFSTYVEVEGLSEGLCGAFRPGHFRGVTTVVTKLFTAVKPHVAIFGQKDYQQVAVIRRMVADLGLDVDIDMAPTVREADGLAMSSRNVHLSKTERQRAPILYQSLCRARDLLAEGPCDTDNLVAEMRAAIERELTRNIDYISIVDPDSLAELRRVEQSAVIALAVRLSNVRLIDNILATVGQKKGEDSP